MEPTARFRIFDLEPDELGRDLCVALVAALCPSILDREVATVDPSEFAPPPPAALMLDEKKLAAFSATAGRFLRFPIADRRCNGTRASVSNAGGNARPSLTNPLQL